MFLPFGSVKNIKHDFYSRLLAFSPNLLSMSFPKDWVRSVQLLLDLDPKPQCWSFCKVYLERLVGFKLQFELDSFHFILLIKIFRF